MANIVLVAYSTKLSELDLPLAEVKAPSNYKDPEKIAAYIEKAKEAQKAEMVAAPYSGTFDRMVLSDVASQKQTSWKSDDRGPGGSKPRISVAARSWLLNRYPKAWPAGFEQNSNEDEKVYFVGFGIRNWLKMMGTECTLPSFQPKGPDGKEDVESDVNLPLSMWVGNRDYRDIESLVIPKDFEKNIGWASVLKARGLAEQFPKWAGPHQDPETDLALITELTAQLGLFSQV